MTTTPELPISITLTRHQWLTRFMEWRMGVAQMHARQRVGSAELQVTYRNPERVTYPLSEQEHERYHRDVGMIDEFIETLFTDP